MHSSDINEVFSQLSIPILTVSCTQQCLFSYHRFQCLLITCMQQQKLNTDFFLMQYLEWRFFRTLIHLFNKLYCIYIITTLLIFSLLILSHPHTSSSLSFLLIYNFCTYLSVDLPCIDKKRDIGGGIALCFTLQSSHSPSLIFHCPLYYSLECTCWSTMDKMRGSWVSPALASCCLPHGAATDVGRCHYNHEQ